MDSGYCKGKTNRELSDLLRRDHTLNGGILFGLEGFIVEIQARAMEVLRKPTYWRSSTSLSGMARGAIGEALDRISGAFAKLRIPGPQVHIQVNLIPPSLEKDGTWLDLPLAVIMLQAAGYLPDLAEYLEGDYILAGELGLHGEVRRVPGMLSIAMKAKPGQKLIVPAGNEKEFALILAKPGHERCGIFAVSTLEEVIEYFQGRRKLENAAESRDQVRQLHRESNGLRCHPGPETSERGRVHRGCGRPQPAADRAPGGG